MTIITKQHFIDTILDAYREDLGEDFDKYRNHVFRVYHLALTILGDKADHSVPNKIAIAAAFHDIGIWTNETFDYLDPSIELATQYLVENNRSEWIEEMMLLIEMHHKTSRYEGPFQDTVEAFRRADWLEVTLGLNHYGVDKKFLQELNKTFPRLGFHWFLVKQAAKQFMKDPWHPFPMFRD